MIQETLFTDVIQFEHVESVIGSGYEELVAKLAIEDKVAYRAARKNMQIHSAIILKINDEFAGFFTFQINHDAKEFCLLQSAMDLNRKDKVIYSRMVGEIIKQNTFGYPMVMTVSQQHDLECPKVFSAIGFKEYLNLSGYAYMVYGTLDQVRMKRLAHATMTNVWNSTKGDWLRMKKEWNAKIEAAGEKHSIVNPKYASREGAWMGDNGMSNVVLATQVVTDEGKIEHKKGKSFNGNVSVLDPVACEVVLRYCKSVLRVVSCDFNLDNIEGHRLHKLQSDLFKNESTLDTIFRPNKNNPFVTSGIINTSVGKFLGKSTLMSRYKKSTYAGKCSTCHEMCGVKIKVPQQFPEKPGVIKQLNIFKR